MKNTPTKFAKIPQTIDIIEFRSDAGQNIASTKAIQGDSVLTRSYASPGTVDPGDQFELDGRATPLNPEDAEHDI